MPARKTDKMTFIEEARRKQLIEVAIETIASEGFVNTSLADIAKRADISKGVISYHFDSKDELINAVIRDLLRAQFSYIRAKVEEAGESPRERLRTYIRASFEHMAEHRDRATAQIDLWGSFTSIEAKHDFNQTVYNPCRRYLSEIVKAGQERGEMKAGESLTLASIIQGTIDGLMIQWVFDSEAVDLNAAADQVTAMIDGYVTA